MLEKHEKYSGKSLVPFAEASQWAQDIAKARSEFLKQSAEYIELYAKEGGKTKALHKVLRAYQKKHLFNDLRGKLGSIKLDKKISKSTYYEWRKAYKKHSLSGLLPEWGNTGDRTSIEVKKKIHELVWENHLCRPQDVIDDLKVCFGKSELPHDSTIRRYVREYKIENWPALVKKHEGQKGLRDRGMEVALGRKDENITRPNQRWEIDTTVADLFTKVKDSELKTRDGKRCKIVGVIDVYSRRTRYYLVEKETSLEIGRIIRDRILAWGRPEKIVIDNGRPYKNYRVIEFCKNAGIPLVINIPGEPIGKPFIERSFRTLTEKLFRRLSGYSGNSVQNKPNEILIEYTMAELQKIINEYIDYVYDETVHSSTGQRPRERMNQPGFTREIISERDLDILLFQEFKRKVRRGCVEYQGANYFHPKLPEGQTVTVKVNDYEASELLVFLNRKYLCTAENPQLKGWTPSEIFEAKKERNRELKTRIKAHESLVNKNLPKDHRIHALIEHHKKKKPIEFPQKAEVLSFPGLQNIPYTSPVTQEVPEENHEQPASSGPEKGLIRNNQEKYLIIQRKKLAGKPLNDSEKTFLEAFLSSNEFKLAGSYLDRQLAQGGV